MERLQTEVKIDPLLTGKTPEEEAEFLKPSPSTSSGVGITSIHPLLHLLPAFPSAALTVSIRRAAKLGIVHVVCIEVIIEFDLLRGIIVAHFRRPGDTILASIKCYLK